MRILLGLSVFIIAACSPGEQEIFKASVNVDLVSVDGLLAAVDRLTDNKLDIDGLAALTNSVPMDDEKQERFPVTFNGNDTELLYHVWREQQDWVHVYVSSSSEELIEAFKRSAAPFARP